MYFFGRLSGNIAFIASSLPSFIDPSFTGESGGNPRFMASPDINTEDFMAAVDFLSVREDVDTDKIGIIGICGFGGMAVNAAALNCLLKCLTVF